MIAFKPCLHHRDNLRAFHHATHHAPHRYPLPQRWNLGIPVHIVSRFHRPASLQLVEPALFYGQALCPHLAIFRGGVCGWQCCRVVAPRIYYAFVKEACVGRYGAVVERRGCG